MINKEKTKKGFTLVELLAVIVILAIILVIAVPQIMSTIENARKGSLESTAKLIASQAENMYLSNTTLGITDKITCDDVAKINNTDYASCSIKFSSSGKAKVTIEGKGKFDGMSVCNATRENANVVDECTCLIEREEKIYSIKDYDACMSYMTSSMPTGPVEQFEQFCKEDNLMGISFQNIFALGDLLGEIVEESSNIKSFIDDGIVEFETNDVCVTEITDSSCFEFENGIITKYNFSCGGDVVIPNAINGENVTEIGDSAFAIEEPSGDDVDEEDLVSLFNNMMMIKSVKLPNTVTKIGTNAFSYNLLLSEITIPESVTEINSAAFFGSLGLKTIYNNTGKSFDWDSVINGVDEGRFTFEEGIVSLYIDGDSIAKTIEVVAN